MANEAEHFYMDLRDLYLFLITCLHLGPFLRFFLFYITYIDL